jgi:hypothetical protein
MSTLYVPLAEDWKPGMRLGRHIRWDSRSLAYAIQPTGVSQTKIWDRKIPILDQGNLGSCTGNATVGVLGTEGVFEHLSAAQQQSLNEDEAVKLYSAATKIDDAPGTYPPTDTGSDGLSVAKAAQQAGYLSGYQHITSVDAAKTAILSGPFIVGTNWLSGMDSPDSSGLVHVKGSIRGGHEYECFGFDASADVWHFCNSWGESWGDAGRFMYSSADFAKLLAQQGDATTFVPISQPAPTPTPPIPTPTPNPAPTGFPLADYDLWRAHPRSVPKTRAFIAAADAWLAGGGS